MQTKDESCDWEERIMRLRRKIRDSEEGGMPLRRKSHLVDMSAPCYKSRHIHELLWMWESDMQIKGEPCDSQGRATSRTWMSHVAFEETYTRTSLNIGELCADQRRVTWLARTRHLARIFTSHATNVETYIRTSSNMRELDIHEPRVIWKSTVRTKDESCDSKKTPRVHTHESCHKCRDTYISKHIA